MQEVYYKVTFGLSERHWQPLWERNFRVYN